MILLASLAISSMRAESSITKPSVPEFTVKLMDNSYDVPAHNYTDPYSGKNTTYAGYHVYNATIDITIKNQAFTP